MKSKQRYNKRKDELILKLHGYGLSIKEIAANVSKSELRVKNVLAINAVIDLQVLCSKV